MLIFIVYKKSTHLAIFFNNHMHRRVGRLTLMLTLSIVVLSFLNPVFELRIFSFLFWLFAGMTIVISEKDRVSIK